MSMYNIESIDTEAVVSIGEKSNSYADNILNGIQRLESLSQNLQTVWQGQASQEYATTLAGLIVDLKVKIDTLKQCCSTVASIGNAVAAREVEIANLVRR